MNPLERVVRRVGESEPLLLAHHPTCDYYDHHTFELYDQQVCMGCFVVYPVGFISLVTLVAARLTLPGLPLSDLPAVGFYALGVALAGPMLADKALPGRRSGRARMVAKASLAVGLALLAFPAVFRPDVRLQTAALFVGFLVPYIAYKGLTVRDDCAGCPEYDDFPNCSGMRFDDTYRWDGDDPPVAAQPSPPAPDGMEEADGLDDADGRGVAAAAGHPPTGPDGGPDR